MAREIHDTIAQGLTGIVTQLEAADQARDRPADRDRHLENAERLARESLAEARRSVEASMPAALEAGTPARGARRGRPRMVGAQRRSRSRSPSPATSSRSIPEIEVALLRTAQEALANVARHAGATRAWLTLSYMGDVVTLDVRDDGVGFTVRRATATPATGPASG